MCVLQTLMWTQSGLPGSALTAALRTASLFVCLFVPLYKLYVPFITNLCFFFRDGRVPSTQLYKAEIFKKAMYRTSVVWEQNGKREKGTVMSQEVLLGQVSQLAI